VVSGAAGAVGMTVAQIAKIKGCRVVGIAGGNEKCRFLKEELGLDEVVDYKADHFKEALEKATPKYIDIFFDNGTSIFSIADDSWRDDFRGMLGESCQKCTVYPHIL